MIKAGDTFRCNPLLVNDASDMKFTIGKIYDNIYLHHKRRVRITWEDQYSDYDYDQVEKYFAAGAWIDLRGERREKLKKLNSL